MVAYTCSVFCLFMVTISLCGECKTLLWGDKNRLVPNRNAIVGCDTLGKCGTWTCGLLARLDMEDTEDHRAKETLSSSFL